jgi:hypothetical protein
MIPVHTKPKDTKSGVAGISAVYRITPNADDALHEAQVSSYTNIEIFHEVKDEGVYRVPQKLAEILNMVAEEYEQNLERRYTDRDAKVVPGEIATHLLEEIQMLTKELSTVTVNKEVDYVNW